MELTPLYFYLICGVVLIALELLVFQFSVFWLIFIGFGALIAAVVAWLIGGEGWLLPTVVFVASSILITVLLLKPLRRWQEKPSAVQGNTAIGQRVTIIQTVAEDTEGKAHWSGTDWKAQLAEGQTETIGEGEAAEIVALDGICLYLKAV